VARWLGGRARIDYLNIVSHHFMSRSELGTAAGRERLALCVFKAPIGDALVSMCELNALGGRDRYYNELRVRKASGHSGRAASRRVRHEGPLSEPPGSPAASLPRT
jgi:hypothetical protein